MKQYQIIFVFLLIFCFARIYSQDKRLLLSGEVRYDSMAVENVHIINISSNRGSLSNQLGEFHISVKENDTVIFSDIQYLIKEVIITDEVIKNKNLVIFLEPRNNELDEIVLIESKNMAKALQLPNAGKKPLNKLERNLNHYSQESLPVVILATLLGQQGGIDDIYNIISGNRKKDRKLKTLIDNDKQWEIDQENIQKIKIHFQDEFFVQTIRIPNEKTDTFIRYCLPKNIVYLFNRSRYLEIIDIFIAESSSFKLL